MTLTGTKPKPTNKSNSCPICGNVSGKCKTFADKPLVLCMVADFAPGWKDLGSTKDGQWRQFVPDTGATFDRDDWQRRKREEKSVAVPQTMNSDERDRFYRQIVESFTLEDSDRECLKAVRHMSDRQIEKFGAFSYRPNQKLPISVPKNLPGVITFADGSQVLPAIAAGIYFPIPNERGQWQGLSIRFNEPVNGRRYGVCSTGKNPYNLLNSEGEQPIAVHFPIDQEPTGIAFTEGVGFKPFIAAQRTGKIVIGCSGGNFAGSAKQIKSALEFLCDLNEAWHSPSATLYPDAGSPNNKHITHQYEKAAAICRSLGYDLLFAWWGQVTKEENDIDEASEAELASARRLTWAEFEAIAETHSPAPQTWLQRINQVLKRRPKPVDSTLALRRELGEAESNVFEYEEGDRLATWKQAFEQGYRYILDISPPGDGKSHDSGLLYPADFGAEKAFYISNDRRNSTVSTLAEWQEVEARHNGLTIDPAGKLRRRKDGQAATVAANCARTEAIGILRSKNIQGADGDTVCQTCPVLNACKFSSGTGYGFKHQRRQALMADRLRIHPASLPDAGEDFSYAGTINIWDEASTSIQNSRAIAVSVADLDQLISHLACQAPQQFIQLQPLLSGLKSLLTVDQPRYGFSYHDVLKALPELDFSALDWNLLSETLQPNLSGLKPPDEIDLDQLAPKERRGLGLVKRALIRETAQSQSEQAEILNQTVLKQWFNEFLEVLNGSNGDIRINHGKLTLTLADNRHREIINASKLNILLEATSTREDAALKLGCRPDEIFVCRQRVLKTNNLSITQVTDLGKLTQQRGDDKQRRVAAIVNRYQALDPTTKVIDFKRFEADGAWWRDSRGVNDFLKVKTLLLVGTPIANIAHLLAEYSILTGTHPTEEDAGFKAFVDRTIRAEFYQAIGRLRANRRPDEQLQIIILSDFDLGIPTNKVKASQITLEAAGKWERFEMAVKSAASQLKANGEKITQTAIAKLTGYSQQYLSRFWKLLLTLLETPYRESSKNSDPPPPLIKSVAEGIDAAINQFCDTPDQVLETINEAFFEWLEPDQWSQVWQNIQAQTQIRILESLALTLPADELQNLEAIA